MKHLKIISSPLPQKAAGPQKSKKCVKFGKGCGLEE